MGLVAGLVMEREAVRAWVGDSDDPGQLLADVRTPVTAGHDPSAWERACRAALARATTVAGQPGLDYLGITVSAAPNGFVLLDAAQHPLGAVVPAELPSLRALRDAESERWAATKRVLLLGNWLVRCLTGRELADVSAAGAAGLVDVPRRTWSAGLVADPGTAVRLQVPLVEAGLLVGELGQDWPLPAALPVVSGCAPEQLAAMGAGGLRDGVVTVRLDDVSCTVSAASSSSVSTGARVLPHAARDLWTHEIPVPASLFVEGVPAAVAGLERGLGGRAQAVVVCGDGLATDPDLPARLADARERDVHSAGSLPVVAVAGVVLVARAVGAHAHLPALPPTVTSPGQRSGDDPKREL